MPGSVKPRSTSNRMREDMTVRLHLFLNTTRVRGRMEEGVEDSWVPGVRNRSSRCHISERRGGHLPGKGLMPGPDEAGWKLAHGLGPPRKRVGRNQFRRDPRRRAARDGK